MVGHPKSRIQNSSCLVFATTPLRGGMRPEESVASSRSGPFPGQLDAMTDIVTLSQDSFPLAACLFGNWILVFPTPSLPLDSPLVCALKSWNTFEPQRPQHKLPEQEVCASPELSLFFF